MILTFNNDQFRILCICLHESLAARHRHYGVFAAMDESDRSCIGFCCSVDVKFLCGEDVLSSEFHDAEAFHVFRRSYVPSCLRFSNDRRSQSISTRCLPSPRLWPVPVSERYSCLRRCHPECLPGYKSAAWVAVVGKENLPDKREDLMLYTRLVFLVSVKTVREDFLFIPDSFGNHWNIPEHDDE